MELDRTEARVLGALVEKRWTVPDQYPLSVNALVAACNQKSNRDPVMELADFEIEGCLMGLRQRGLAVVHEQVGGRVQRYAEKLMDELRVSRQEIAILAELLLRGPQTSGELYRRCTRMAHLENQGQVDALLRDLAGGHFVRLLPRETGQRFARWEQLLCPEGARTAHDDDGAPVASTSSPADVPGPGRVAPPLAAAPAVDTPSLRDELDALREEVAALRKRVDDLEALL